MTPPAFEHTPEHPESGGDQFEPPQPEGHRVIRIEGLSSLDPTPERIEARRLAGAARDVIRTMVTTSAGTEELARAADRLEEMARMLGEMPSGQAYDGFSEAANAGPSLRAMAAAARREEEGSELPSSDAEDPLSWDPEQFAFFDQSPLIGLANPLSPPLYLDYDPVDETRLRGRVEFGPAYEGPPGCVHGGYVAAVFDELLGATQSLSGSQGMTAHLGVDYRSPTPLGEKLVLHGWLERTEGRKIWARGTLHAGDRLCAEADALFLALVPGMFEQLLESRDH